MLYKIFLLRATPKSVKFCNCKWTEESCSCPLKRKNPSSYPNIISSHAPKNHIKIQREATVISPTHTVITTQHDTKKYPKKKSPDNLTPPKKSPLKAQRNSLKHLKFRIPVPRYNQDGYGPPFTSKSINYYHRTAKYKQKVLDLHKVIH